MTAFGPLLHIQCTQAHTVHPLSTEHTSAALEGSVSLSVIKSQVLLPSCMEKGIQWLERVPWQWLQRHDCALRGGSHRKTRRHITRSTIELINLAKRVSRLLQLFLTFTNCTYNQKRLLHWPVITIICLGAKASVHNASVDTNTWHFQRIAWQDAVVTTTE